MIGAIIGDVIGAPFEWKNERKKDFELFSAQSRFTDDTVMTVATAEAIMKGTSYEDAYRKYFSLYPNCGYGGMFLQWGRGEIKGPYGSYGNGSAMRVGPVGYAFNTLGDVRTQARLSAEVTHNHPEGIKGAEATAAAVHLARSGWNKEGIAEYVTDNFGYNLNLDLEDLQENYTFNHSCQGTVPPAIFCFLQGTDFEDCIRNAISIGGDSDTIAAICGSIAGAYYPIPMRIWGETVKRLDLHLITVVTDFINKWEKTWA